MFPLIPNTILVTLFGSRAYGMARPDSDVDLRGVCIPPQCYFTGFSQRFEQADSPQHLAPYADLLPEAERAIVDREGKVDGSIYEIRKFFKLAAENNPNILEALFCRDSEVRHITPAGELLRDRRFEFLSRRVLHTFSGYAHSQLERIKRHRRWLLNPVDRRPERGDFGLPDVPEIPKPQIEAALSAVRQRIDGWEIDLSALDDAQRIYVTGQVHRSLAEIGVGQSEKFNAAGRWLGFGEAFIATLDRERQYRAASDDWKRYQEWKRSRNPERAEMEARFGYDTKHAAHLVRLLTAGREILLTGDYQVWRPDAERLLRIRAGEWTYDQLVEWAEREEAGIKEVAQTSVLPRAPLFDVLDELCMEIVEGHLRGRA